MAEYDHFSQLKTLKVTVHHELHIAYITFNRPESMNTYNFDMSKELPSCIEAIAEDNNIKILVLNGAGKIFMAGGDIELLKQAGANNLSETRSAIASLHESILSIQTMDKLVVAAVHGACAGAGISLMLAADLAYVAEGTKFNTAYVNLGLSPDGGMTYTMPRTIGHKKALELILLSEPFFAEDAYRLGLINKVLPQEQFDTQILNIVKQLSTKPTLAMVNIKKLLNNSWGNNIIEQLEEEKNCFIDCTKTSDFQKGIENFLNKSAKQ
jgi:2-(1,2-epoxy-1,2-dihydrophenyl)acetyl-CoA isomerase